MLGIARVSHHPGGPFLLTCTKLVSCQPENSGLARSQHDRTSNLDDATQHDRTQAGLLQESLLMYTTSTVCVVVLVSTLEESFWFFAVPLEPRHSRKAWLASKCGLQQTKVPAKAMPTALCIAQGWLSGSPDSMTLRQLRLAPSLTNGFECCRVSGPFVYQCRAGSSTA